MSIFHTINYAFENDYIKIDIANVDCSNDHFGNRDNIVALLKDIDILTYDDDFNNKFCFNLLQFFKPFTRIENIEFYHNNGGIIILIYSDVEQFKIVKPLERKISLHCKHNNLTFLMIELLKKEYKTELPKEWKLNKELTKKFNTVRALFG